MPKGIAWNYSEQLTFQLSLSSEKRSITEPFIVPEVVTLILFFANLKDIKESLLLQQLAHNSVDIR
jgi:hypothetical protein